MRTAALLRTLFVFVGLGVASGPASAVLFNGSYSVTANSNPSIGLAVQTFNTFGSVVNSNTNSFTGLNVPLLGTHFQDLFEIFALESPPYSGNDLIPQLISVTINITSPAAAGGTISGTTVGTVNDVGIVTWSGPLTLIFPGSGLRISLLGAEFSDAFNGIVTAQFVSFVPEPGTAALLALALIGLAATGRRGHS